MRHLWIIMSIVLVAPSLVFGSKDCSSIGGVCKHSCAGNENREEGFFLDCGTRQVCCTEKKKPDGARAKGVLEKKEGVTSKPKTDISSSDENASGTTSNVESAGPPAASIDQILVCSPMKDTYAVPDTLLECGNRKATLRSLYGENYRLIQIVVDKKALYYLEKK